jgi:hypothetical protein
MKKMSEFELKIHTVGVKRPSGSDLCVIGHMIEDGYGSGMGMPKEITWTWVEK